MFWTPLWRYVVHPNPIPEFSFENVCDGNSVTFLDQGIEGSATVISRSWDIENDGTTDYALDSINHLYSSFGTYSVEYNYLTRWDVQIQW